MLYWEKFDNRWEITADLVAVTGLRVGAGGESAEPTATDLPLLKDNTGRPYIPGSSLRGVLRSHVERIIRSLEPTFNNGKGACYPTEEDKWCVPEDTMQQWRTKVRSREADDAWLARQVCTLSCRVCRVFGSPWLASRVRIADLYANGDITTELRDGVAIDREKETVKNKYDFEAATKDAHFTLNITAENLDRNEFGLLWLGVRELERGHIAVGGFKGRGLGQVKLDKLTLRGVETEQRDKLKAYLLSGRLSSYELKEADAWLEALLDSISRGD